MAKSFSFDIVSDFDSSELDHAIDQARRELTNRYDFKGTAAMLDYVDGKHESLKIEGDNDYQLDSIIDMLRSKLAKRSLSQKILNPDDSQRETAGMIRRQVIPFTRGLDQEKAKKISKLIRDDFPKVKPQIQGDAVRVTGPSKDDLQAVMQLIKEADFDFPINFENYR